MTYNWSERGLEVVLRDCAYAAYLTGLVEAGFTKFPLGMFTAEEREALESSDDRPDETGANLGNADQASIRRYGVSAHNVTEVALSISLQIAGRILILAGNNGRLPRGHRLRRWQPNFTGNHMWAVKTTGTSTVRIFDPLAPMKYTGDDATIGEVVKWAFGDYQNKRMFLVGEYATRKVTLRPGVSYVNIRSLPNTSARPLGTLRPKQSAIYIGTTDGEDILGRSDWHKIAEAPDVPGYGYVSAYYTQVD